MIQVNKEGVILDKTKLEFENDGVLNPAVIKLGDSVYMFYRAVRLGNFSTIGYCKLDGPLHVVERHSIPCIVPELSIESMGVEDPRLVKIDDLYYLTYTAYDGTNAQGALATSKDLKSFKRLGAIVPPFTYAHFVHKVELGGKVNKKYYTNYSFYYREGDPEKKLLVWDKNVIFFPRRIHGKLVFLHRIRPGIQIVFINKLEDLTKAFWDKYLEEFHDHIVIDPIYPHEISYVGGGCPPIETEQGWLLIYHGVHSSPEGNIYSACAALLDLNNPTEEIVRLPYPLISPQLDWELNGVVNNVCFPTGTAIFGDTLFIYYGAADERIACASVSLTALINELVSQIIKK